jgi:hypothetical protein
MATDFPGAFAALRKILRKQRAGMIVRADTPNDFTLITPAIGPNRKPLWFGAVLSKKSAVTYHLMPLYYNPKLMATIPPELRARMQGKTCFNFQRPDAARFAELDALTRRAREQWERAGFLEPGPVPAERLALALEAAGADPPPRASRHKAKGAEPPARASRRPRRQAPGTRP